MDNHDYPLEDEEYGLRRSTSCPPTSSFPPRPFTVLERATSSFATSTSRKRPAAGDSSEEQHTKRTRGHKGDDDDDGGDMHGCRGVTEAYFGIELRNETEDIATTTTRNTTPRREHAAEPPTGTKGGSSVTPLWVKGLKRGARPREVRSFFARHGVRVLRVCVGRGGRVKGTERVDINYADRENAMRLNGARWDHRRVLVVKGYGQEPKDGGDDGDDDDDAENGEGMERMRRNNGTASPLPSDRRPGLLDFGRSTPPPPPAPVRRIAYLPHGVDVDFVMSYLDNVTVHSRETIDAGERVTFDFYEEVSAMVGVLRLPGLNWEAPPKSTSWSWMAAPRMMLWGFFDYDEDSEQTGKTPEPTPWRLMIGEMLSEIFNYVA